MHLIKSNNLIIFEKFHLIVNTVYRTWCKRQLNRIRIIPLCYVIINNDKTPASHYS